MTRNTETDRGVFETPAGRKIFNEAVGVINDAGAHDMLSCGVAVGLSGGADSVMLLYFFSEYRRKYLPGLPILAIHVNHMIRGEEAERDEKFSMSVANSLGIEFIAVKKDVPSIARETGQSLEEAARNVRYSSFRKIISGRNSKMLISVAHNSTDNLETQIFNMMRGSGTFGLEGILPFRDGILRPLITASRDDIRHTLDISGIKYIEDSTNDDCDITRNYIRQKIIPLLTVLNPSPESAGLRLSRNMRSVNSMIDEIAAEFLRNNPGTSFSAEAFSALPAPVAARVMYLIAGRLSVPVPESTHINEVLKLLARGGRFSLSLPGRISFVSDGKSLSYMSDRRGDTDSAADTPVYAVDGNITPLPYFHAILYFGDYANVAAESATEVSFPKVNRISIQQNLSSAIINGDIYVRSRIAGDSYSYGGMTHKLKKMMCDTAIPAELRDRLPVLCDGKGILWVPGFGVREDRERSADNDLPVRMVFSDAPDGISAFIRSRHGKEL